MKREKRILQANDVYQVMRSFRWVKPAASLKLGRKHLSDNLAAIASLCFRWVKPAASLKPAAVLRRLSDLRSSAAVSAG